MKRRIPMKGGEEYERLTEFGKRYLRHKPGQRKYAKRKFNRRERKYLRSRLDNPPEAGQ